MKAFLLETVDELENVGDLDFGVLHFRVFEVGFYWFEVCEFKY